MSMNRDNFRANQPPSKVLHIRNLPPDATEQDVVDLCKHFGRIIKTKVHTGQAKAQANQAFVEFENVNCAIQMIYSFVGSADPPKVRNKTVYLQYSTRQEIGSGNWGFGGGGGADHHTGNVILIIMDNIQVAVGPTLDTVHMLCAAFGEVAKIAMFEKASGLQALVQFKDARHAKEAQQTLDGTSIPEHLVPSHPGKITMKVSFSAHSDLNIRSQSERSRDFTIPYEGASRPAAAAAAAAGAPPVMEQYDAGGSSNVLLCMIDDVAYAPNVESLHTIFSTYGYVQKMTIFEKNGNWQALVQYPDDHTAGLAMQYLNGHNMYPGGKNKLKLSYSNHRDLLVRTNNDRNWDFLIAPGGPAAAAAAAAAHSRHAAAAAGPAVGPAMRHDGETEAAAGSSHDAAAGADAAGPAASSRGMSSSKQSEPAGPVTAMDYEHAHNEAAREAIEALGDSLSGVPSHSGGPRTMVPQSRGPRPAAAQAGYGQPAAGPPPGAYGYPPAGYGYPPGHGQGHYPPGYGY